MVGTRDRVLCAVGLLLFAPLLGGCPSPNLYATPRTTPEGKFSHTVAAEGFGGTYKTTDATGAEKTETSFVPTLPTYQLRYGATDDVDVGFRVANLTSLGFDAKYNPLRSRSFDLAVDPAAQWIHLSVNGSSSEIFYLHVPVLLGFNVSDALTIVASPGAMYSAVTSGLVGGSSSQGLVANDGVFARLGLGVNVRFSSSFAIQPEVTALRGFTSASPLVYTFGLGFNFGKLPLFGEAAEQEATPAPRRPADGSWTKPTTEKNPRTDKAGDQWLHPSGAQKPVDEVPR